MQFIAKAYRTVRHWRWPSLCRICEQWDAHIICPSCLRQHAQSVSRCRRCAMPSPISVCGGCQERAPLWLTCHAALRYAEPWRSLIADFKFQGDAGLVKLWGERLREQASVSGLLHPADLVVPVPLSRERLRERGFNQSLLLAKALNHPHLLPDGLLRLRHTQPQASLPRHERLHNLDHAIACNPLHVELLQKRRVLLVDDVMTTGSTLTACTQALRQVGVVLVDVLVLARADHLQAPQSRPDH